MRQRSPAAYTIAEIPDLYNTQHIDLWWNWGWRRSEWASAPVFRYVMPAMIPCWCIDENQRDVIADAFATGSFMAIATRNMTGRLSDDPELAAQVGRLARLRKETAAFVSHGRFLDNRGLKVRGGTGYAYESPRGLAVALANEKPVQTGLQVTLSVAPAGGKTVPACTLHVEGEKPRRVTPNARSNSLSLRVTLPPYGAGVLTVGGAAGRSRS